MPEDKNKQPAAENQQPAQESDELDGGDSLDAPDSAQAAAKPEATVADKNAPDVEAPISDSPVDKAKSAFNIYFIIYIVLVVAAIGIIVFAVSTSKKVNNSGNSKAPSLTSQQISSLKGNTTLVGDAKTTLDVQSNSVFEGQVLARSDLNVAGALKVGGSLSLSTLNVGGAATVGGLQVNGTLGVTQNTTVQGTLAVQKDLTVGGTASFGRLSVSSLTVSSLQLSGDLAISRHIVTNGTQVSRSAGTALGGGGTVSVSGTDAAGTVTINTGNSPPAGLFVTVNFAQRYGTTPRVIISPVGFAAGNVTYYVTRDTTGFSIGCSTPPPAGSSFSFDYIVVD